MSTRDRDHDHGTAGSLPGSALSTVTGPVTGLLPLAGLVYGAVQSTPSDPSGHPLALALTVGIGLGWAGWLAGRHWCRPAVSMLSLAVLAASGGAMTAFSVFGAVVVGVAALYAATFLELLPAVAQAAVGMAAAGATVAVTGQGSGRLLAAATGALLGLLLGLGRRQRQARARTDAELAVARERSAVEHERAELLTERNRIAREVHDVLAHTLSALSVQMTALDALVEDGAEPDEVRASVGRSRRLVTDGLEETRRAVQALREEPVALDRRLTTLAAREGAAFRLHGSVRPLPPATGTALLRVAQEALTNARKHAPGAPVSVDLAFDAACIMVTVTNEAANDGSSATGEGAGGGPTEGRPAGGLAASGGGYGLRGMRERVELLGGTLEAGPDDEGWRVRAEVPA